LIRDPLTDQGGAGFAAFNAWVALIGQPLKPINSAYRNPNRNARVGGRPLSRHLHGDAVDLRNVSRTVEEYNLMADNARTAQADFVEPLNGPCGLGCVHADWRRLQGGYR
jgi:hypothetical protein